MRVKKKERGSRWESNPPKTVLPPRNGFEDRETHRDLATPKRIRATRYAIRDARFVNSHFVCDEFHF